MGWGTAAEETEGVAREEAERPASWGPRAKGQGGARPSH